MEQALFSDLVQSLNEAVSYADGDKSKGRSVIIDIPDNEAEMDQLIFRQLIGLSIENKVKIIKYASELAQASP